MKFCLVLRSVFQMGTSVSPTCVSMVCVRTSTKTTSASVTMDTRADTATTVSPADRHEGWNLFYRVQLRISVEISIISNPCLQLSPHHNLKRNSLKSAASDPEPICVF